MASIEAIIRNRQTNDFPNLTQSYYRAFGALPAPDEADPMARNMIDIDDGLALNTLKTVKVTDQAGDLILESGDQIEDEARVAAPGSAPFLTAAAMAANIQRSGHDAEDARGHVTPGGGTNRPMKTLHASVMEFWP